MNPVSVGRLICLYGLLVLCVEVVDANHPLKPGKTKKNQTKQVKGSDAKITYGNLSKQLLKRLDSSCKNTLPPDIPNGKFVRFKKSKIQNRKSKSSHYMVATFRCHDGYKFKSSQPGKMFCSRTKWVGKKPVCERIRHSSLDVPQGDDPNVALPSTFDLEECPQDFKRKCEHFCQMYNGHPSCKCLPGFQKEGTNCIDIDECKTNNGGCSQSCSNSLGSFSCTCAKGFRLSSDGKSCEDVNECHLRNGHGPCQDTCENTQGSYKCGCSLNGTQLAQDLHTCADINECTVGTSGCSHSCINTHGRAFCTCPEGLELGPDWKTCHDINECEDPEIKSVCTFGCFNFVGSYHCAKHSNETLSDQPVTDNETLPKDVEDYEEDDDYNDEYEDEGDYDDEEEYDERKAVEREENKENEQSTTMGSVDEGMAVDPPDMIDRIDNNYTERDKNLDEEKEVVNTFTVITTARAVGKESEDYEEEDYDEDYGGSVKKTTMDIVTSTTEQVNLVDNEDADVTTTSKESKIEDDITLPVTFPTTVETTALNKIIEDTMDKEVYPKQSNSNLFPDDKETERATVYELPNKKIQNRKDDDIDDYHDVYDSSDKQDRKVTDLLKVNHTKEIETYDDDGDDDEDDYDDDEDYEDANEELDLKTTTVTPTQESSKTTDTESEHIKKIISKIPEVDIDKVNTDFHQIISNYTDVVEEIYDESTTESVVGTTATPMESSGKEYNKEVEDNYDVGEESSVVEKEVEKCGMGFALGEDGKCTDLDECEAVPKLCSHDCENTIGSYICTCPPGYNISHTDTHFCEDIDECTDLPCSHACINEVGSYHCVCPMGLTLQNNTCVNLTCSHGETKVNGLVQCTCPPGFILGPDQRTCEDVDECQLDNTCSHLCHNTIGSYECQCEAGFHLENGKTCTDIDECKGDHSCPQMCKNLPGSFQCTCKEGYEYNKENNTCNDINECDEDLDLDECNHICVNYEGGYECACHLGYELSEEDVATCEDINECLDNNGNCTQNCINLPGTFKCGCNDGYALNKDNLTCHASDPCIEENGGCSHECVHENGVALCKCPKGHVLEGNTCYMYDPCVANNGGCSHNCSNKNGEVHCICPPHYQLQNATTCVQNNPCEINNGNCSHFCEFIEGKVNCMCPDLHMLENSRCVEIDPCLENNGGCSHICSFKNHTLTCSCPITHELRNETHCYEKNPCLVDNGGCTHTCSSSNGKISCLCRRGYRLKNEKDCLEVDPCAMENGGCSHSCENVRGIAVCSCPRNYVLKDSRNCMAVDPCSKSNGGCSHACRNVNNKAKCSCPDNHVLKDSKTCVGKNPCNVNKGGCSHVCNYVNNKVKCSCPDRYNLINNTTCMEVDPCFINNGGCSHTCVSVDNKPICLCPDGYKQEGKKCTRTNPCETKNGGCSHVCSSINGRVLCKCPSGYELIKKTCFRINPCMLNNGGCPHGCTNVRGQAKCISPRGSRVLTRKAKEDPCAVDNGGCSHFCHSKEGRRECSCPSGYLLRPNKRVCKELNECKVNRGGCSHGCKNLPGTFKCTCPYGYELNRRDNKTCVDIDECRIDKGGCEVLCKNLEGSYTCECPERYTLQRDKKSCKRDETAKCRVPLPPENGVLRCANQRSEYGSLVQKGTTCNVQCNKGYEVEGIPLRLCGGDGTWEGDEPRCVVATCTSLPPIQNGWYLPGVCNTGKTYKGESCEVYCRKGFKRRSDFDRFICGEDLGWKPDSMAEQLRDACVRDIATTYIRCPSNGFLESTLPPGQRDMLVRIPRPESNVDFRYITSSPAWGMRLESTLPAGRHEVRFTAMSPSDHNSSASCNLVIDVLDKEEPRVNDCPEDIERNLMRGENMQIVHWREPMFHDNVGVVNIFKSREPGSEFGPGLHPITYVANDDAGNRAFCNFNIRVKVFDSEVSNSLQHQATYATHSTAGMYKAVLICPSGVHYMSSSPDSYDNMIAKEAGCRWEHTRMTRPMQPQSFRIPMYAQSRLPTRARSIRRQFFKWNR